MMQPKNKIALVTGAGLGIGHAICKALANDNKTIIAVARNKESLDNLNSELNDPKHQFWAIDLSTETGCNTLVEKLAQFSFPHIVVCNLHIPTEKQRIINTTKKKFSENFTVNIDHLFFIMQKTLAFQRNKNFGRWIAVSSAAAHSGLPGQVVYNAQKATLESVIYNIAAEEGKYAITANIVSPGFIETPSTEKRISKEIADKISKFNVLKRAGKANEVAAAVQFLACDNASYITGVNIPVSGGAHLAWQL